MYGRGGLVLGVFLEADWCCVYCRGGLALGILKGWVGAGCFEEVSLC